MLANEEHGALVQRRHHVLPLPRRMTLMQGRENAHRTEHATLDVDHRSACTQGLSRWAGHVREPTHHLGDFIERRAILVRAAQKALLRAVDQPRVGCLQGVVAEAKAIHRARPEILDQDVRVIKQAQHQRAPLVRFQVHAQAAFIAVVHREVTGAGAQQVPSAVALHRLDLDHIGAEVRENQSRSRAHDHVGELNDAHPGEGQTLTTCHAATFLPC